MRSTTLLLLVAGLAACRTTDGPQGQGGAQFRQVTAEAALPADALYHVCWPADAAPTQRVALVFDGSSNILFEAREGASNSTARCIREIAASYPWDKRPSGTVELAPPRDGVSGWEALAWVKLLAPSRYGPERGLTDPTGLARSCVERGGARPGTRFEIAHSPALTVRVVPSALTDSERCLEAVLGATAWPSTRAFSLSFDAPPPAGGPGDVALYFAPQEPSATPLDPTHVKEAITLQQQGVTACWEAALSRRAGLGGGRTFRFRTDASGAVTRAWVAGNVSDVATAADYLLDVCLAAVLQRAHLDAAGDGVYTWLFAARG